MIYAIALPSLLPTLLFMNNLTFQSANRLTGLLVLLLSLLFTGCMLDGHGYSRGEVSIHYAMLELERDRLLELAYQLEEERAKKDDLLADQQTLIADLQLGLLQKHARINELLIRNKQLVSEFVRYNVEMKGQDSKVEAVRLLAEAAAIIEMARQEHDDQRGQRFIATAEKYLQNGDNELQSNNFEGASYLAYQAIDIVKSLDQEGEEVEQVKESEEITFVLHLPMKVLRDSNIRAEPNNKAEILQIEKKGELVNAIGLKGQWVKVDDQEYGLGWIHYSLLSGLIN